MSPARLMVHHPPSSPGRLFDDGAFFRYPGRPWERGTNENTNGLPRQYFPKRSDLTIYSPAALAAVAERLNNRPRKTLGG